MSISDIITIISLVIAIFAIISEKKRKHLSLKFGYLSVLLYSSMFLLINYFVFYNQFYSKGFYLQFLYFDNFGFKNPKNYAYIISIFSLFSILFKIWYSFYPNSKKDKVLKYYKSLIENNEIQLLLDLIEKYHIKDIIDKINSSKEYNPKENDYFTFQIEKETLKTKFLFFLNQFWRSINNFSKLNKQNYALLVLHKIIADPAFIILASNIRPYLFASIFSLFKKGKQNIFPNDIVNQHLKELLKEKNFWLIKELKEGQNFDFGQLDNFFLENKIVSSLIKDLSVAEINNIWQPFGEEAISEIEKDSNLGLKSQLYQIYRNDDLLWNYKTFISIKFFKILIIESIVKQYKGTHFFLHYYWYITEKILNNFIETPPKNFENTVSNYHYLIQFMINTIFYWLDLSNKHNSDRFYDIIICLGNLTHYLCINQYFGEKRKIDFVENIVLSYCSLDNELENTNKIRKELEKILIKPSMMTENNHPYFNYIAQVWKKFDKIPHRGYDNNIDYDYFKQLKENVIIPLNLNPDEY